MLIRGKGISRGVAGGPLHFLKRRDGTVTKYRVESVETEKARFAGAQETAIGQLTALAECCRREQDDESASLFETHAMLVMDEDFAEAVLSRIGAESCCAQYAVQQAGEQFAAMFKVMDDGYMRLRAADIRDVSRRLANILMDVAEGGIDADEPVILAADDLAPSETIRLDRKKILAFVTREGSGSSHTAILARSLGIPAICGLGDALKAEYEGRIAYADGETGCLYLDPDERTVRALKEKRDKLAEAAALLESMKGKADVTLDGRRMSICCSIGSPEEVAAVVANDGQGVGLFRSEFLYLAAGDYPTEDEQFSAYRKVACAMNGKRTVIRTLDIGADKQTGYFNMKKEENPALGMRGIRVCLSRPEVFHSQLRAIYRASAYGRIAILFPMIASLWEVRACRRACMQVMAELEEEGIPFSKDTETGVMIETPASVLIAGELAKEVNFFSVGTNDLTQYMLACDRQSGDLGRFCDPHHPAVLRAVKMAADAAHAAGIRIGVCGELAADEALLPLFLGMGIDELSVPPSSVLPLRAALRQLAARDCTPDMPGSAK
ncbi:MAG: phosphoenolpyruvate--protein phosphotransferase [Clostridia bacterium]|nr:phosphoenolpyruvate--protein phosphotransferase [Clostridia bacterium]